MSRIAIRRRYAAPRRFVRHPAQLELFDHTADASAIDGIQVPPWRGLLAWHSELDRQSAIIRPRRPLYHRFDATARQLTVERIRTCRDEPAVIRIVDRLCVAWWKAGEQKCSQPPDGSGRRATAC